MKPGTLASGHIPVAYGSKHIQKNMPCERDGGKLCRWIHLMRPAAAGREASVKTRRSARPREDQNRAKLEEELEHLEHLEQQCDPSTYASLLRQCGNVKALSEGKRVHAHIRRDGGDRSTYLGNLLVQMYGKCGGLKDALRVFDNLQMPNVFSWNFILAAFVENGHLQEAGMVFDKMPLRDVVSWTAIVAAYAQNGYLLEARAIFDIMPERNVVSWNAMIAAYAQNGHPNVAVRIFRLMDLDGTKANASSFINVLDACGGLTDLEEGKTIHSRIIGCGFQVDVKVGTALINMYGKCGGLREARWVFDGLSHRDLVSWNAMITAYTQNGHAKVALSIFREMVIEGVRPNQITFVGIVDACGYLNFLADGKIMHATIVESELQVDVQLGTALVNMYCKCGSLNNARSLFDGLAHRDIVLWNSMIAAYGHNGLGKEAVGVYQLMSLEGLEPGEVTFLSILAGCSHAGLLEDGRQIFMSMQLDYNAPQSMHHYICMVDLLGRAGHLADARNLIHDMPFEPNPSTWRSLLAACKLHGNVVGGQDAAERLYVLDPDNSAPYMMLSSIYSGHENCTLPECKRSSN